MPAITITHAKSDTIADWSGVITVANSTGGTTTDQASNLVRPSDWNSAHAATIQLSASDIGGFFAAGGGLSVTTNTDGVTYNQPTIGFFEPFPPLAANTMTFAPAVGSFYLDPFEVPSPLSKGYGNFFFANSATAYGGNTTITSNSTGAYSRYQTNYHRFGVYSQVATAGTKLSTAWTTEYQIVMSDALTLATTTGSSMSLSRTCYISFPYSWDTLGGMTYTTSSTTQSSTLSTNSTASSVINGIASQLQTYITGSWQMPVGMTQSMNAGQYVFAYGFSSTSSSTGTNYGAGPILGAQSILALSIANLQPYRRLGSTTTNISSNWYHFDGYFSTTSTSPPTTIGTDGVMVSSSTINNRIYWNYAAIA